jgi:nicotinate dehydrogenase subunit B
MTATDHTPTTSLFETLASHEVSRRDLLKASGAMIVGFSLLGHSAIRPETAAAQFDVVVSPDLLDSWIAIDPQGNVTLFTGKVELGTGVQTALAQIAAEELDVAFDRMSVVQGDTALTVDQGVTAGSQTIASGGAQVRQAAAEARLVLLHRASERLGVPIDELSVTDGLVTASSDPLKQISYGELVKGGKLDSQVSRAAAPKNPADYSVVGQSIARVDIPAKVTGEAYFIQDLRVPGMLHARTVKPPSIGAMLVSVDESSVSDMPGVVQVVVRGNFVAVVAEREEQAIEAASRLRASWSEWFGLPTMEELYASLRRTRSTERVNMNKGDVDLDLATAAKSVRATYVYPFQAHGSIGPSCAIADVTADRAIIWSPSSGTHGLRGSAARLLGLPTASVRIIYVPGSGSYGSNGANDATVDAAIISQAVGRPVRLQWTREDEHRWVSAGPAMAMDLRGGLNAEGHLVAWEYQAYTPSHYYNDLLTEHLINRELTVEDGPPERPTPWGGDARIAYEVDGSVREVIQQLESSPLRSHPLRAPGQIATSFATEGFMDELAVAAGADPVEFRLRHLKDERAIAVLQAAVERAGWDTRTSPKAPGTARVATGRGIALIQRPGTPDRPNTYVAMTADVEVDRESGAVTVKRIVVAHDCGLIINPDGLRNQIEGNIVQTLSRALKEELKFDQRNVTSIDWDAYPILSFKEVPEIDIVLINRSDLPASGAGEPASCPVTPAVANAIFDAVGARLREAPFTPARVKQAMA